MSRSVKPYKNENLSKKKEVALMFDKIAPKYDFLNHFLSLNIDKIWRRKAVKRLKDIQPERILDVACGTGDLAIRMHKSFPKAQIIGVDISEEMLNIGRKKIQKKQLESNITLQHGDSEKLPFSDSQFDAVTAAFGVRNFEDLPKGISEMYRVLRKGGKIVILEFSQIKRFPLKQVYRFYFFKILPAIGRLFSKDAAAYSYLPESVNVFPSGSDFLKILETAGFRQTELKRLSAGIASIYTGVK